MTHSLRPQKDIEELVDWTEPEFRSWLEGLATRGRGIDVPDMGNSEVPVCVMYLPGCHSTTEYTQEDREAWSKLDPTYYRTEWACGTCESIFWLTAEEQEAKDLAEATAREEAEAARLANPSE